MHWKKAIGYGILLWVLMFVIVSIFIAFRIYNSATEWLMILIGGVVVYILAGRVKPKTAGQAIGYGFTWVICGIILDAIVTTRFNPAIFYSLTMWLSYLVGMLTPLLRIDKNPAPKPTGNETI